MANPRQRRKSRSGTAKTSLSKASRKNKHKVTVKGPEVLVANWDRTKTVRQNYAKLGLMPNLNPRQAGGIEPVEGVPFAIASMTSATMADLDAAMAEGAQDSDEEEDDDDEEAPEASTSAAAAPAKLSKGLGRIIRDENGKVLRIVLGGENGEEVEEDVVKPTRDEDDSDDDDEDDEEEERKVKQPEQKPWGEAMPDWEGSDNGDMDEEVLDEPRSIGQGIPIGAKRRKVHAKTDIVRELEALAATQRKVIRHTSLFEGEWLLSLVAKYGDDVAEMAKDRKANVWQKTVGELKRAINKAGGFEKLKAKVAAMEAAADAEDAAASA